MRLVWRKRFNSPAFLYLVVHYVALMKAAVTIMLTLEWSHAEHKVGTVLH